MDEKEVQREVAEQPVETAEPGEQEVPDQVAEAPIVEEVTEQAIAEQPAVSAAEPEQPEQPAEEAEAEPSVPETTDEVSSEPEAPQDVLDPAQELPVSVDVDELAEDRPATTDDADLKAILEAVVYITDEPLTVQQLSAALSQPIDRIKRLLDELSREFAKPEHGLSIREVAGGYKMATKPEHHEAVRAFVKKLTPPLKLSLAALETLAVIAYKQPVTGPEIMEIRGVQGLGVLKTLLDRKLIAEGGRKNVVGKPILYKTTKEFLVQFGLKGLGELPTLKEFEELGRLELVEETAEQLPLESTPAEPPATSAEETPVIETPLPSEQESVSEAPAEPEDAAVTPAQSTEASQEAAPEQEDENTAGQA